MKMTKNKLITLAFFELLIYSAILNLGFGVEATSSVLISAAIVSVMGYIAAKKFGIQL
jgi:hypothetical protein